MKGQRLRFKLLALMMFALFALLAVYGGYSVITYGNRWFSSSRNPRVRAQKENVIAGNVYDRGGVLLAFTGEDGSRQYQREEAARRAVVHLLGDSQGQVSNGVETFQTGYLYGFHASFPELAATLISGDARRGDDVTLTIDSRLCTEMAAAFDLHDLSKGKRGAAVVLNYRTGEVLGMTSRPSFDPMNITTQTKEDEGQPFWNRATQSLYPPGSTFKTITASAALEQLGADPEQTFYCSGGLQAGSQIIHDYAQASHGELTLKRAYTVSCNNVFASLGLALGSDRLRETAEAFGFNDNFLFRDLVVENSNFPAGILDSFQLAMAGFGQSTITATPLHMCMVAAAVANDGVMMEPRMLRQVQSATGKLRELFASRVYRTPLTPERAAILQDYMAAAVNASGGTGSRAKVDGLALCGKTGTAESSLEGRQVNYGWFIGYIDSEELPFAVAVLVEDIGNGHSGGSVAAPIAGDIFRYLRDHPGLTE